MESPDERKHRDRLKMMKESQQQVDIVQALSAQMEQEKREFQHRLDTYGVENLEEDEKLFYEAKRQIEEENAQMNAMIDKLLHEDMIDINFKQFEMFKRDDLFMDEWTKQLI